MLPLKRFPGIIWNHRYVFLSVLVLTALLYRLMLSWGIICTNTEAWDHFDTLCSRFKRGEAVGDLCKPLCVDKQVDSLSCQTLHSGKSAVFTVSIKEKHKIVLKTAQEGEPHDIFHWIETSGKSYPTEDEFTRMIQHRVNSKLNISLPTEEAQRLAAFVSGSKSAPESKMRHSEMKQIWRLIQDNEYLLSLVYHEKDFFPHVVGSCGQYFAVEYLQPVFESRMSNMIAREETNEGWAMRVNLGLLLIDLIEDIDSENLLLCDVKPSHFGLDPSGRVKFLDLDVVFPKIIADSITADGRTCAVDSECHIFDCQSKCDPVVHLCDSPVINNNLQIVCEKIFLGWTIGRQIVVPGLLMTMHTPSALVALLRQCSASGSSDYHNKERLIATMTELDRALSITYSDLI